MPTYVFSEPHPSSNFAARGGTCETPILNSEGQVIGKVDPMGTILYTTDSSSLASAHGEAADRTITDIKPNAQRSNKVIYEPLDIKSRIGEELLQHRQRRATAEELQVFKDVMKMYIGTHNFWNYTAGAKYTDASATRHMLDIQVYDPEMVQSPSGVEVEWIKVLVHGQSFQLHQIRKMMGALFCLFRTWEEYSYHVNFWAAMAILVVRTGTPISVVKTSFTKARVTIPKAPGVGLILNNVSRNPLCQVTLLL